MTQQEQQSQTQPALTWDMIIQEVKKPFNEIATAHKAVTWREECEFALQAVRGNAKLSQCIPVTVQNSIKNVASVGLTLNPAHGYAYLVPESKKHGDQWLQECQLRISFKGLIKLATDSGSVEWVKAEIVKEADTFEFTGHGEKPKHTFNPFTKDRGAPVGVYCIAKTHSGDYLTDVMAWDEVLKIKSKAKTQNVWNDWTEEMAKKAIIKRASKQWPKTDQFERLSSGVDILNQNEGSREESYTDEQKEKYDHYLFAGTPIEFVGFIESMRNEDEQIEQDLYNSFPKGEKVAGKEKHKIKMDEGYKAIAKVIGDLQSGDDELKEEAMENLTKIEKQVINKRLN